MKSDLKQADTFALIMGFIGMASLMASTMYLPFFPEIRESYGTTSTIMKLTMTALLVGAIVGKLLIIFLYRTIEEKPLLIAFIITFIFSSILCSVAPNIETFFAARFIQGIGAAGGPVIVRAIAAEDFKGRSYFRAVSTLVFLFTISPGLAFVVGSHIGDYFGWNAVFYTS